MEWEDQAKWPHPQIILGFAHPADQVLEISSTKCFFTRADPTLYENLIGRPTTTMLKDLSMMYCALWDWRHEGATRISQCTRRLAPRALMYPSGPWVPPISQCTIHHTYSRLWHELFGFDISRSRNLQAKFRSGRWRIMHCGKSMHSFVGHVHA